MNMKRFTAGNMQQALKLVREELGPEAVILSSKKTSVGTEVVCALDYDEAQARETLPEPVQASASSAEIARKSVAKREQIEQEMAQIRAQVANLEGRQLPGGALQEAITEGERRHQTRQSAASVNDAGAVPPMPMQNATNQVIDDMQSQIRELRTMLQRQSEEIHQQKGFAAILQGVGKTSEVTGNIQGSPAGIKLPGGIRSKLERMGILPELLAELAGQLDYRLEEQALWRSIIAMLAQGIATVQDELIDTRGAVALVGPTGVGKTTTIAKLAVRFVQKYGAQSLALVTTDRFRVAASQQLQSFGRLLNVPVFVVGENQTLDDVLDRLSDKRLVLIDTAGLNPQDNNWQQQRQDLKVERHKLSNYLVLSAVTQSQVLKSNYHHFNAFKLNGCILTKLDEAYSLGEVLSVVVMNRLAVAYWSDGQQIPDDLHHAKAHGLVVRAVSLEQKMEAESRATSIA